MYGRRFTYQKSGGRGKGFDSEKLDGMDVVFLLAGLGGGTGGGAVSVIARLAREAGALVFAFCPLPFSWEKGRHARQRIV